jgi:SAM-dependent methyltransferase
MSDPARAARLLEHLRPYRERARVFAGWSFPDIRMKHLGPQPPWDYEALVRAYAAHATAILDLGTGGAEFFERVTRGVSARIVATEAWRVNAPLARARLAPSGGRVVRASAESGLPFRAAAFDLIVARHEALDPADVARILRPGGLVVTQQVGSENWSELARHFPRRADFGDHLASYRDAFRTAGLEVEVRSHEWKVAYETLGDFVFMLLVAPWEIPDFDPVRDVDALLALDDDLRRPHGIEVTFSRYLIVARKPSRAAVFEDPLWRP